MAAAAGPAQVSTAALSVEDVMVISAVACEEMQVVVRDPGLLDSAAQRPMATAFGREVHPELYGKAAALLQALLINHPLVDGNKRTAWLSCVTLLALHGEELRPDIDAAERLILDVISGELSEVGAIAEALRALGR